MTLIGKKLGAAVVGLGVGAEHARSYLASDDCELLWLYDLDLAKAKSLSEKLGAGMVAEKFEDILADPACDVVSICSYDDAHGREVVAALNAGKNVFVEKPLCHSLDELREIKQTWQKSRLHLISNLVLRGAPLFQWLQQKIASGELGKIYAIDGEYLYGRIHKITEGWRKDIKDYSVMLGGGVHVVDLMLGLSGEKPATVTAAGNRIATAGTAFRYYDYIAATFHFPSGMIGRITANFGCVHRHQYILRIFGTKGTFIYDDQGPRLHTSRDPYDDPGPRLNVNRDPAVEPERIDLSPLPPSKGVLIPDFVRAIHANRDSREKTQHEFDVISVCLAADQSAANSKYVAIDYV